MADPKQSVLDAWEEIKVIVQRVEEDLKKSLSGNASAGIRARRGLRLLKKNASDIVKTTVELHKASKSEDS